jgi:hypothetical protein
MSLNKEGKSMFKKSCFLILAMAVSICLGVTVATAAPVIFSDNITVQNPDPLHKYQGTYDMYGAAGYIHEIAVAFTPQNSGSVTEIDLEITRRFPAGATQGTSPVFRVEVWQNVNNLPGGTMLYGSAQTANAVYPGSVTGFDPLTAFQSISGVTGLDLTSGTSYFLVVGISEPTSDIDWFASSSVTGNALQYYNNAWGSATTGGYLPAFKIIGETPTTAPEPATMLLLGLGMVGLAGVRRFRK